MFLKFTVPVPVSVVPVPFVQFPVTVGTVVPIANVIAFVLVAMFNVPKVQLAFIVIVALVLSPVFSIIHVSCASGKLLISGVPPDVVAHAVAFQLPPATRFQYSVLAALKVIFVLFPKSPNLVPVKGIAAPVA